MNKV